MSEAAAKSEKGTERTEKALGWSRSAPVSVLAARGFAANQFSRIGV